MTLAQIFLAVFLILTFLMMVNIVSWVVDVLPPYLAESVVVFLLVGIFLTIVLFATYWPKLVSILF